MIRRKRSGSDGPHEFAFLLLALVVAAVSITVLTSRLVNERQVELVGPAANGPIAFVAPGQEGALGVDNLEIYAVSPNGDNLRNLTNSPSAERDMAWSPDGTSIAFLASSMSRVGDRDLVLHQGLYVIRADASDLREILPCEGPVCRIRDLSWSPDGTRIAFVSDSQSSGRLESALFVIDADGGEPRELCSGVQRCGQGIADPQWSPDGTRILFSNQDVLNFSIAGVGPSAIFIADSNAGRVTRLTNQRCIPGTRKLRDCAFDSAPAWSPDGEPNRIRTRRHHSPPRSGRSTGCHEAGRLGPKCHPYMPGVGVPAIAHRSLGPGRRVHRFHTETRALGHYGGAFWGWRVPRGADLCRLGLRGALCHHVVSKW